MLNSEVFRRAAKLVECGDSPWSCVAIKEITSNIKYCEFWIMAHSTTGYLHTWDLGYPCSTKGRELRVQLLNEMALALEHYNDEN